MYTAMVASPTPLPRPDRTDASYNGAVVGVLGFLAVVVFFYVLLDGPTRRGPKK
jgi:hypothetical protein